jgi:hypothetical protein
MELYEMIDIVMGKEGLFNFEKKEPITKEQVTKIYKGCLFLCNKWRSGNKFNKNQMEIGKKSGYGNNGSYPLFSMQLYSIGESKLGEDFHNNEWVVPDNDPVRKDKDFDELQDDDSAYYIWFKYAWKLVITLNNYIKTQKLEKAFFINYESDKYEDIECWIDIKVPIKD